MGCRVPLATAVAALLVSCAAQAAVLDPGKVAAVDGSGDWLVWARAADGKAQQLVARGPTGLPEPLAVDPLEVAELDVGLGSNGRPAVAYVGCRGGDCSTFVTDLRTGRERDLGHRAPKRCDVVVDGDVLLACDGRGTFRVAGGERVPISARVAEDRHRGRMLHLGRLGDGRTSVHHDDATVRRGVGINEEFGVEGELDGSAIWIVGFSGDEESRLQHFDRKGCRRDRIAPRAAYGAVGFFGGFRAAGVRGFAPGPLVDLRARRADARPAACAR